MKTKFYLWLSFLIVLVFTNGCAPISPYQTNYREVNPWTQDFESAKPREWPKINFKSAKSELTDGTYAVTMLDQNSAIDVPLYTGQYFDHVRVDVDMAVTGTGVNGSSGILCKGNFVGRDWVEYYRLIVGSNGAAEIDYFNRNQKPTLKLLGYINRHDSIHTDGTVNHLRAECVENHLTLWVNGVQVLSVPDDSTQGGMVGFSVISGDKPDFHVRFDNYRVARMTKIPR